MGAAIPKVVFSQRTVEDLVCPPDRKDVLFFDDNLSGFGLRVTKSGSKIFLVQYAANGSKRRAKIGRFGALTIEQARRQAKVLLGQAASGGDPHRARKAAASAARAVEVYAAYTFELMVAAWAEARIADRRPSYITEAAACLKRNLPEWKDRPAGEITFAEAVRALDAVKLAKGPVTANRCLAYGRAAYGWAVRRQQVPTNPLKGIEPAGREVARDRVLTVADMAAIWRACDQLSPVRAAFVRTLMLTLQRVSEVSGMQWSELDSITDPTTWTVPAAHTKNRKPHTVHLAVPLGPIIRGMPRIRGNPSVFIGRGHRTLNGGTHTKEPIETELERLGTPIPDWRLHDFRRAGVTALADAGTAPHVADRLLNHVTGSISGVAAVYQRAQFLIERRAALERFPIKLHRIWSW